MIPFQGRQKLRKILYSKVTLLALFIVLFSVANGAWDIYQKAKIARSERDIAKRSLADLESRTEELKISLERLKSERGIEEEVRQKYTVARPGEEVVIVVDESIKKGENGETVVEKGLWGSIVSVFGF